MQKFQKKYPKEKISKEDLFYYVYGLLHSDEYRSRYANNLVKELPRIPAVKSFKDFRAFNEAGRKLANLHLDYEKVAMYPAQVEVDGETLSHPDDLAKHKDEKSQATFQVKKMRYGKNGKDKDRTTLHYNRHIAVTDIPLEAYDYVINGKTALDWVVDRQCIKTDKESGIVNDANDWAVETMQNPRYPLELFLRVITVSLETQKIVRSLPSLEIAEETDK